MKPAIMVMGVSGCGKSTIGAALAKQLNGVFLDGDDYHPQSNVDHMADGRALSDEMRWPWLDALGAAVNDRRMHQPTIFACSALKKTYRVHLRNIIQDLQMVYLDAPQAVVAARLERRQNHYMPATLLDSQYETLEVPNCATVTTRIDQDVAVIVQEALLGLDL